MKITLSILLLTTFATLAAFAQDTNLMPKYGLMPKTEMQKAADAKFLAGIDESYKGDRRKAAEAAASRGWQFLRQGNKPDAMRRFNQAWLIDNTNSYALWGMAVVQAEADDITASIKLFTEAEKSLNGDLDFAVDHAKTLGIAGVQAKNNAQLQDALSRFARLHARAPQHTLNLQNWAVTLFYSGNYSEAWKKIQLAETTPRRAEVDPNFVAALQSKMPRPK